MKAAALARAAYKATQHYLTPRVPKYLPHLQFQLDENGLTMLHTEVVEGTGFSKTIFKIGLDGQHKGSSTFVDCGMQLNAPVDADLFVKLSEVARQILPAVQYNFPEMVEGAGMVNHKLGPLEAEG